MPQKQLFALRDDWKPVFDAVEAQLPLAYFEMGNFSGTTYGTWSRGVDLPQLGTATAASGTASAQYLVLPASVSVIPRRQTTRAGELTFIDQLANPDSITLTPSGRWGDIILSGRVATVSTSAAAKALMRRFESALKKHFVKVGAYWVGPAAKAALQSGTRLTIAQQSPPEYDLRATLVH